jgi:pimeloyl-ACP methyl ester carboxylesterase
VAQFETQLKTISVPTLAIWGEEDEIVPIKYAYRIRQDVPGIQFQAFPKTGHAPQEEQPAATANRLIAFLEMLPP